METLPNQLLIQAGSDEKLPPVDRWNPSFCGDIDMRIAKDGRWFYQNSPIGRERMVKMFSRILWKEGEHYYLKTPVEKVGIRVEDVPFQVISLEVVQENEQVALRFTTSVGDQVIAGVEHPLRIGIDPVTQEPSPYLMIRWGMEGRLSRNVFYQLVELAEEKDGHLRVSSQGVIFDLGAI
ncbi:DUF1285 domain-containing protein [Nitrincola tibetensis]|uniref:DUF1285 domain-containing protein n=2 Tax=Nitrincola tibetensis TaxID=2219697 RepID=A0A364NL95_9GAMM|nr:DUF1285 domain-containing protein [Nitrincola tibetensis]RAU17647.1 DUF1285 domain-containing protein [Nitrincola tibetensis]